MRMRDWSADVCSSDLVGHPEDADRACRDPAAGEGRIVEQDQRVERVGVLGERVGDEPVVGRIGRGGEEPAIQAHHVLLVVVLVLVAAASGDLDDDVRSEEHTSELQSLMRISYAVFCLKKNKRET